MNQTKFKNVCIFVISIQDTLFEKIKKPTGNFQHHILVTSYQDLKMFLNH